MTWHVQLTQNKRKDVHVPLRDQIRAIIEEADSDRDGTLTKEEVKKAFGVLGSRLPAWRAFRCIQYADTNGDGRISGEDEINNIVEYVLKRLGDE